MTIRHQCARKGCYLETLWDWAILDGCFAPTSIAPTDVDGMVERNGHFLFLECKSGRVIGLESAQARAFRALARSGATVFVIFGEPPGIPVRLTVFRPDGTVEAGVPIDIDGLRRRVRDWFTSVESTPALTAASP